MTLPRVVWDWSVFHYSGTRSSERSVLRIKSCKSPKGRRFPSSSSIILPWNSCVVLRPRPGEGSSHLRRLLKALDRLKSSQQSFTGKFFFRASHESSENGTHQGRNERYRLLLFTWEWMNTFRDGSASLLSLSFCEWWAACFLEAHTQDIPVGKLLLAWFVSNK